MWPHLFINMLVHTLSFLSLSLDSWRQSGFSMHWYAKLQVMVVTIIGKEIISYDSLCLTRFTKNAPKELVSPISMKCVRYLQSSFKIDNCD